MSSDLLNGNLRTRIRHLRDRQMEEADEATAMKPSGSHRPHVVSGMPDQIPDAEAWFSGSGQSSTDTNDRFVREDPW